MRSLFWRYIVGMNTTSVRLCYGLPSFPLPPPPPPRFPRTLHTSSGLRPLAATCRRACFLPNRLLCCEPIATRKEGNNAALIAQAHADEVSVRQRWSSQELDARTLISELTVSILETPTSARSRRHPAGLMHIRCNTRIQPASCCHICIQ